MLDEPSIKKLIKLCRIHCTEEEEKELLESFEKIVTYFEQLNELDTSDVPPCFQVIASQKNVLREDRIGACLPREEFLKNAPAHVGGMIKVPPVLRP
jgi:aspartyl-tRNA(Asn)/glutamyl-tRNA(Gln) amidotransferase subunit C